MLHGNPIPSGSPAVMRKRSEMQVRTMHIQGFDDSGPVCGATGRVWTDTDWAAADNDSRFRRCERCEKKLGPGGLERLRQAREELARVRAARKEGEAAGRKNAQSKVSAYPLGSPQAQSYAQGYDAGALGRLPPKPSSRTMSPALTEFLMTLESAKGRAHDYSDKRAVHRHSRDQPRQPEPRQPVDAVLAHLGPPTERHGSSSKRRLASSTSSTISLSVGPLFSVRSLRNSWRAGSCRYR